MPEDRNIAVTSQYPQRMLNALDELAQQTHVPKAHHFRAALRQYLESQGKLPLPILDFCQSRVPVIVSARTRGYASLPETYALMALSDHLFPVRLDVYLSTDKTLRTGRVLGQEGSIVVGGPRRNQVAAQVLAMLRSRLPFEMTSASKSRYTSIINRETGERWTPDHAEAEKVSHDFADYGLLVRAHWPQTGTPVVLCAGCHAFGTYGAVRALTEPAPMEVLQRLLRDRDSQFGAVVQVRVRNFSPEPPMIVDLAPIT